MVKPNTYAVRSYGNQGNCKIIYFTPTPDSPVVNKEVVWLLNSKKLGCQLVDDLNEMKADVETARTFIARALRNQPKGLFS